MAKNNILPLLIIALFAIFNTSCKDKGYVPIKEKSTTKITPHFAGTETCISCHNDEHARWENSDHDLAMQIADSTTVLGDFNTTTFKSKGVNYLFTKKGNNFYVNTEGGNGKYQDFKIKYTFGVFPLQQYLIAFPNGSYQCLMVAWDSNKNIWFNLQPNLVIEHNEWMHWSGGSMSWNSMCADCHSTNLQKKYDSNTQSYETTYSIINVSCEACHGPASKHVEFYKNKSKSTVPPELYMTKNMDSKEVVQKCARCHSRRTQHTDYFDYTGHYLDHYAPSLIIDPLYELDGQIKDEVYVYGSFVQSKMYHNNVSCKDCHDVHSLKLKKQGNDLCLSCHVPTYNEPEHHFHKKDTPASLCINCHMDGKTYMGNDYRRDHSFRVPRPDQSIKYDTPNACNKCHTDKSPVWASNFLKLKFGEPDQNHYSNLLLEGTNGNFDAYHSILKNSNYPEIIRATALYNYANQNLSEQDINNILHFINDSSPLVRKEAVAVLEKINANEYTNNYIQPLLLDSIRSVRISAAQFYAANNIPLPQNREYKKANKELKNSLENNSEFPSGQHKIGLLHAAKGDITAAEKAYRNAIFIDNYYNLSRLNLALIVYNQGKTKEAEELYLKVASQEPHSSYPHFMLGLLYNEINQPQKSIQYLKLATEKKPILINAFYNYGIKLQEQQKYKDARTVIEKGLKEVPNSERLLYLKVINQINTNNTQGAKNTTLFLLESFPDNPAYKQLLDNINSRL
ncbi:multiheme c-type cytochrome [Maribacter sp.]|uniref:multiheme c-type cytochrome n=1 Tax=Maribacter sp. TaxID=1897614 RepID=UPI0025C243BC|nr:multiheme c-type cytochrome [Maribacter sp.]